MGKEKKEKTSSELSLNTNSQGGAEITVIPMSLETSDLTLINHANSQGASF